MRDFGANFAEFDNNTKLNRYEITANFQSKNQRLSNYSNSLTMQTTFQELLSADNTIRQRAEANIQTEFSSNPSQLAQALISELATSTEVATLCCVLLKKYFLDLRATATLSPSDLESLKTAIEGSLDFEN